MQVHQDIKLNENMNLVLNIFYIKENLTEGHMMFGKCETFKVITKFKQKLLF